ncbi:hypothetical protein EsCd1HHP049_04252 [Escherichia sp. HH154_1D]|nr:hypothetical protein EsCdI10290_04396 [Escherichia sp. 10290]BDI48167.1 hypothetical protein EsCd1HHP049_04252 [Escherichia sp. HH154_1D]
MALVAGERKPPHVADIHLTTSRGLILNLDHSRIAAKRCHYNTGGYMTLAELGMAFWHDLAAPVIAGILASLIVNWLNKRK